MLSPKRSNIRPRRIAPSLADSPDRYQAILAWLKRKKSYAVVLLVSVVVIGIANLTNAVGTLAKLAQEKFHPSRLEVQHAIYITEHALIGKSVMNYSLSNEVRDFATNCRLLRSSIPMALNGPGLSSGEDGANVDIRVKVAILSTYKMALKNLQLRIAGPSSPLEISSVVSTPNIHVDLKKLSPSVGTNEPYLITIKELDPNDFGVITLVVPLKRDNVLSAIVAMSSLKLLFVRSDQYPNMDNILWSNIPGLELLQRELTVNNGNYGFDVKYSFNTIGLNEIPREKDFSFLPPASECKGSKEIN